MERLHHLRWSKAIKVLAVNEAVKQLAVLD